MTAFYFKIVEKLVFLVELDNKTMDQITFIGIIGATIILIAFIMNQLEKWKSDYLIYDLFNFIGGLFLIIYAIILVSYPFIILNLVWAIFSLRDIFIDLKLVKGKKIRFLLK